jgi:hypothetical protein
MPPSLATHPQKQPQLQNNRNPKNKAWSFTQRTGQNRLPPKIRRLLVPPSESTSDTKRDQWGHPAPPLTQLF